MSKKDEELNEVRRKLDKLPVEVIKEVEVIVEKPNDKSLMLQETLTKLRKELIDKDSKITELEGTIKNLEQLNKNQGAVYMKGSNLTQNL
jgi:predicted RNase H-like nuclease (RuvC/YqgF family)